MKRLSGTLQKVGKILILKVLRREGKEDKDIVQINSEGSKNTNKVLASIEGNSKEYLPNLIKQETEAVEVYYEISNPIEGEIIDLKYVPDPVFSERLLGEGFAIIPSNNKVCAPSTGILTVLFPTKHAIAITTEEGLEILIHIGIDTVNLNGEGFITHVKQGDRVNKGDVLITFDTKILEGKAKSLISPVIITNMDIVRDIKVDFGNKKLGERIAIVTTK